MTHPSPQKTRSSSIQGSVKSITIDRNSGHIPQTGLMTIIPTQRILGICTPLILPCANNVSLIMQVVTGDSNPQKYYCCSKTYLHTYVSVEVSNCYIQCIPIIFNLRAMTPMELQSLMWVSWKPFITCARGYGSNPIMALWIIMAGGVD